MARWRLRDGCARRQIETRGIMQMRIWLFLHSSSGLDKTRPDTRSTCNFSSGHAVFTRLYRVDSPPGINPPWRSTLFFFVFVASQTALFTFISVDNFHFARDVSPIFFERSKTKTKGKRCGVVFFWVFFWLSWNATAILISSSTTWCIYTIIYHCISLTAWQRDVTIRAAKPLTATGVTQQHTACVVQRGFAYQKVVRDL